ncbi:MULTISPECIES: hypothetical protein [Nocardia]|uniref:hypothetical protein n=1 Tax=Nocardia TaxID=1817 RepID=UPI000BEFAFAC|nr:MULTISPECIES: hypothetical protein [Nocardia]MBF6071166.1 hypothetical protein [Nocardia farcinica]MBF6186910.1 hypothetical protein [Nocardia farcinica]MBF6254858.1 hypothetical protein [Nocardia farcinica]MBF6292639.1 hypothetical protein [Nocardia farcinica]MBF6312002.1 hypothetical protein [Nocardia farcinica]
MLVKIRPDAQLSAAEGEFVDCLRSLPITCLALVDVRVDRGTRRVGAVLVLPRGVAVVEIRGFRRRQSGILSARADAAWTISGDPADLDGETVPADRLEHALYAVRTTLERALLDPGHVCGLVALVPFRGVVVRPSRIGLRPGREVLVANVTDAADLRGYLEKFNAGEREWTPDQVLAAAHALGMSDGVGREDLTADGFGGPPPGPRTRRNPLSAFRRKPGPPPPSATPPGTEPGISAAPNAEGFAPAGGIDRPTAGSGPGEPAPTPPEAHPTTPVVDPAVPRANPVADAADPDTSPPAVPVQAAEPTPVRAPSESAGPTSPPQPAAPSRAADPTSGRAPSDGSPGPTSPPSPVVPVRAADPMPVRTPTESPRQSPPTQPAAPVRAAATPGRSPIESAGPTPPPRPATGGPRPGGYAPAFAPPRSAPRPPGRRSPHLASWLVLAVAFVGILAVFGMVVTAVARDDDDPPAAPAVTTTTSTTGAMPTAPPRPSACFPFQSGC